MRKKISAILSGTFVMALVLGYTCFFYDNSFESLIMLFIQIIVGIALVYQVKKRFEEIDKGEEDDLSKY